MSALTDELHAAAAWKDQKKFRDAELFRQAAARIEELEARFDQQEDFYQWAVKRIKGLEEALREIASTKDSKELGLDEPDIGDDQNIIDVLIHIARRSLEDNQ